MNRAEISLYSCRKSSSSSELQRGVLLTSPRYEARSLTATAVRRSSAAIKGVGTFLYAETRWWSSHEHHRRRSIRNPPELRPSLLRVVESWFLSVQTQDKPIFWDIKWSLPPRACMKA